MKVYILHKSWYDDEETISVWTDKEKAMEAMKIYKWHEFVLQLYIEEWDTETQEHSFVANRVGVVINYS